ncbi:MAG: hypothetical protein WC497_01260 [Patescibacteria group bacterium]
MPRKTESVKLFVLKSRVNVGTGDCYRIDVVVAHTVGEARAVVEEQLKAQITLIRSWMPGDEEITAAIVRLLRRYPKATEVLSSMVSAFMSIDDGSAR